MADCSKVKPNHVKMETIEEGCRLIEETYGNVKLAKSEMKAALGNLGARSLQYGTNSAALIDSAISDAMTLLDSIQEKNSELPAEYIAIAEAQNEAHDAAIAKWNENENKKKEDSKYTQKDGSIGYRYTPDYMKCSR